LGGVLLALDRTSVAGTPDGLDLLLGALGPADRQAARQEVVGAVTVLHLDDVAGGAEALDLLGQDELHLVRPPSARRARVRQQGHLASVLDGDGDVALMLHAVPGHPAGADLAAVRDELAQKRGVLVVDVWALVLAEAADLLLRLPNDLGHCGALFLPEPGFKPEWSSVVLL